MLAICYLHVKETIRDVTKAIASDTYNKLKEIIHKFSGSFWYLTSDFADTKKSASPKQIKIEILLRPNKQKNYE